MELELPHKERDHDQYMTAALSQQLDEIKSFTFAQLVHKHTELFGEPPRSRHKQQVVRRIGWRLQVIDEGGLSERARLRARQIANDADLRVLVPRHEGVWSQPMEDLSAKDRRLPAPGTTLVRDFKGKSISVHVLEHGFEHEGEVFGSLSAVVQHITGTSWNGYRFFHLTSPRQQRHRSHSAGLSR